MHQSIINLLLKAILLGRFLLPGLLVFHKSTGQTHEAIVDSLLRTSRLTGDGIFTRIDGYRPAFFKIDSLATRSVAIHPEIELKKAGNQFERKVTVFLQLLGSEERDTLSTSDYLDRKTLRFVRRNSVLPSDSPFFVSRIIMPISISAISLSLVLFLYFSRS